MEKLTQSQQLKTDLKSSLDYNQRMVSVKENPCGLSYSFTFTIRDPKVDLLRLAEFVNPSQSVDKCRVTGEILSGGNTYVHITMTNDVISNWASKFQTKIQQMEPITGADSIFYKIDNFTIYCFNSTPHVFRIIDRDNKLDLTCPTVDPIRLAIYLYLSELAEYDSNKVKNALRNVQFPIIF